MPEPLEVSDTERSDTGSLRRAFVNAVRDGGSTIRRLFNPRRR